MCVVDEQTGGWTSSSCCGTLVVMSLIRLDDRNGRVGDGRVGSGLWLEWCGEEVVERRERRRQKSAAGKDGNGSGGTLAGARSRYTAVWWWTAGKAKYLVQATGCWLQWRMCQRQDECGGVTAEASLSRSDTGHRSARDLRQVRVSCSSTTGMP